VRKYLKFFFCVIPFFPRADVDIIDADQIIQMFSAFMEKLVRHPWLQYSQFVFCPERNTAGEVWVMERVFERYRNTHVIRQQEDKVAGWWTTNAVKRNYCEYGVRALRCTKVFFLSDMLCECPWASHDYQKRKKDTLAKLSEQLLRFKSAPRKDPVTGKIRLPKISGRIDNDGKEIKEAKDDLGFTFFMFSYFIEKLSNREIPATDVDYVKIGIGEGMNVI